MFEAFFGGGAASRGPIGRVRPGADSLLRMRLDLEECATGVTKQVTVDTAVLCDKCQGKGTNDNSNPMRCDTCGGRGEVQSVQRSLLGQVMTSRPCPTCRGVGEVIPDPLLPLRRGRTGTSAPRDQRQDPRRGRQRDAGPAGRAGRGRTGRRPRRRPLRRGPRTAARHLRPRRRRPTLHGLGANGRRRPGHRGDRRRDPRRAHRGYDSAWDATRFGGPASRSRDAASSQRGRAAICMFTSR